MPAVEPDEHRRSGRDREPADAGVAAAGIGVGALMVACCAGPALIAGGRGGWPYWGIPG